MRDEDKSAAMGCLITLLIIGVIVVFGWREVSHENEVDQIRSKMFDQMDRANRSESREGIRGERRLNAEIKQLRSKLYYHESMTLPAPYPFTPESGDPR